VYKADIYRIYVDLYKSDAALRCNLTKRYSVYDLNQLTVKKKLEILPRFFLSLKQNKDRQCTHKRNTEARSRNHCCSGKETSIIYSECVSVTIVIQHATGMSVLYSHMWSVWLYNIFPRYFISGTIFGAVLLNIKRVLIFSTAFAWNISF
jgi:hypothetical protein